MSVVAGVGVIIVNQNGDVLLGKRSGTHAPYWSIFGGHVDPGETFETCAVREIQEEIGITLRDPVVIGLCNNLNTYREEGKHTVSICMLAQYDSDALPVIQEPDKFDGIIWCDPDNLPEPHFEASRNAIHLWRTGRFYLK